MNDNVVLRRLSFYLPSNATDRYWVLDFKSNKISPAGTGYLNRFVQSRAESGESKSQSFDGLYWVEKTIFSRKIEFAVYTEDNKDYLYLNCKRYVLDEVDFLYERGFVTDSFSIINNGVLVLLYKYVRPFWRILYHDDVSEKEDLYPLMFVKTKIEKRIWRELGTNSTQNKGTP